MDPVRKLRLELERGISQTWDGLTEGWRDVITRSSDALTHFADVAKRKVGDKAKPRFPQWAVLAGECWETSQAIIVRVELPGMRKADIHVSIHRSRLQIRGEKKSTDGADSKELRHYYLMERAFGRFERSVPLPENIDASRAEVSYLDGVVIVILPKTKIAPPTQLSVQ